MHFAVDSGVDGSALIGVSTRDSTYLRLCACGETCSYVPQTDKLNCPKFASANKYHGIVRPGIRLCSIFQPSNIRVRGVPVSPKTKVGLTGLARAYLLYFRLSNWL
ncbi:uncharacterized protein LAJ45_00147 [Morchella importuna]|uniref:uncharacterized protein n=1 Tax=Morchella importuna TaxID=1174673 RepID=UPI001E8EBD77|nr:uncharacterized protein LAJ45_00147 [Morchella importuna]KAH8155138.1 hypothetical protein LAJ45_00147 [Morchella importuna]